MRSLLPVTVVCLIASSSQAQVLFDTTGGIGHAASLFSDTTWLAQQFSAGATGANLQSVEIVTGTDHFEGGFTPSIKLSIYDATGSGNSIQTLTYSSQDGSDNYLFTGHVSLAANHDYFVVASVDAPNTLAGWVYTNSSGYQFGSGPSFMQSLDGGATWNDQESFNWSAMMKVNAVVNPAPEPASMLFLGTGFIALLKRKRRN